MKIGVLLILINFANIAFSQKLFLRITPILGVSFGTFKSHTKESTNNTISYLPVSNIGNIGYSSVNYSLQVDFLKFGNKLEAGLMLGNVSDYSGYVFEYFSGTPILFENGAPAFRRKLATSSSRLDVGLSFNYKLNERSDSSRWNKKIVLQPMFSINRATPLDGFEDSTPIKDGFLYWTENKDNTKSNNTGFAINFRFDWQLMSKKRNKNILTFSVGYRQGFTVTSRTTYRINHTNGMEVESVASSKTSAFYLGISKPLNFIK
jgi:hypothetical protein